MPPTIIPAGQAAALAVLLASWTAGPGPAAAVGPVAIDPCPHGLGRLYDGELEEALQGHWMWLHVAGSRSRPADLRCLDLSGHDFRGAELQEAVLTGSLLSEADFTGADLIRANLSHAGLNLANLSGAKLSADLRGASLFRARLRGADLRGAHLDGANLQQADLTGADLEFAELHRADLTAATLASASAQGASFSLATLDRADLNGADLRGAVFFGTYLIGTDLRAARMQRASLDGARWEPDAVPTGDDLIGLKGVSAITFNVRHDGPAVRLREELRHAGLRDLEREAGYAVERQRTEYMLRGLAASEFHGDTGFVEYDIALVPAGWLRLALLDWIVGYGRHPGRALWLLLALTFAMAVVYALALREAPERAPGRVRAVLRAGAIGLGLSAASAVAADWRRGREGWLIALSRAQFLVGLWLLAMWFAFCFWRPLQ